MAAVENPYKVAHAGSGRVVILRPPKADAAGVEPAIEADAALNLAAWIVAIADPTGDRVMALVKQIRGG